MWSDRSFYIAYAASVIITFTCMVEFEPAIGYTSQLLPHAVLLTFWFYKGGAQYKFFSLAWIGYTLTDFVSIIENSYSAISTSLIAIASISFLTLGFHIWRTGYTKKRAYLALIAVGYGAGYFMLIHETIPRSLLIPIVVYATLDALLFVVVAGMRLRNNFSYIICLFGVFIYIVGDGLYAYHFFVEKLSIGEPMMGLLHFASQALFIIGILEESKTKDLV